MIEVELPDGAIAEFPDGTPPEQIEQALAQQFQQQRATIAETATAQTSQPQIGQDALNVLGEFAASANRSVTEFIDFLGPDTANAILQLAGSESRVPTLTSALEQTGIRGGFMQPGVARDVTRAAGALVPVAASMAPVQGRNLANNAVDMAEEFLGVGSAKITEPVRQVAASVSDTVQNALPSKAKQAARLPLLRQSGDIAAAGFKLNDAGRVVRDAAQQKALKAGVDEGAVAMFSSANKATRTRLREMLDVVEKGKKNLEFRNMNRPSRVVGDAITDRLQIIQKANRAAAGQLDNVASSLKGKPVNIDDAMGRFLQDLDDAGIGFDQKTGALNFDGSDIEGLTDAQNIVKRVVNRLYNTQDPTQNAYNVHRAKKFIDEQVSYGKTQAGLSGRMETIVKRLRRNLDQTLDKSFPEYDRVNTAYKETRDVIDEVQSLAGSRVDLYGENANKALGVMSRKVLSNYATGTSMEEMLQALDNTARRYSTPLNASVDDELIKLISAESEMRRLFPTAVSSNTFQGEIGSEVGRGIADLATGNKIGFGKRMLNMAGRVFTKDDDQKLDALKELLKD